MKSSVVSLVLGTLFSATTVLAAFDQEPLGPTIDPNKYRAACPDYKNYATRRQYAPHPLLLLLLRSWTPIPLTVVPSPPYSQGPLALPFQRPSKYCRTFASPLVEQVIDDLKAKIVDKDLARLFENAFPNTLDTTVRWHVDGTAKHKPSRKYLDPAAWKGPQSFIVTGDINAEWLRDSTNQLAQYQLLAKKDKSIHQLILGAINTQAEYVIESPYCNAFQPPPPSGLEPTFQGDGDTVHPLYEQSSVFECKYELDSLAHFLSLSNQFYKHTGSTAFLNERWLLALDTLLEVLAEQSKGTFNETTGVYQGNEYRFQRQTNQGTETLALGGIGNPLNSGTGLIRSAFRPSDDATILGFFIPANAMMSVELTRTAALLQAAGHAQLATQLASRGAALTQAIWDHGVVPHAQHGQVFAFEVDGYGSHILMDDANLPSLLSLPLLGFTPADNPVYQNTRRMILSKHGNPYFLTGNAFRGIGGPHVGLESAWPMSVLVQAMTSHDDAEIQACLASVKNVSMRGVVHESVNVDEAERYSSTFAFLLSSHLLCVLDSLPWLAVVVSLSLFLSLLSRCYADFVRNRKLVCMGQ